MAFLTVEMHMLVTHRTCTFITAHGIFHRPRSVINTMYQVMGKKQGYGAENGGFVHCLQPFFQIRLRYGTVHIHHRTKDKQTVGGWLYTAQLQFSQICIFFHNVHPDPITV